MIPWEGSGGLEKIPPHHERGARPKGNLFLTLGKSLKIVGKRGFLFIKQRVFGKTLLYKKIARSLCVEIHIWEKPGGRVVPLFFFFLWGRHKKPRENFYCRPPSMRGTQARLSFFPPFGVCSKLLTIIR
jgi:hypothetical protein